MFDVENISSKYSANRKNNFLILGEGTTDDINDSVGEAIKSFSINFTKVKAKFCVSLHYNSVEIYLQS